MDEVDKEIIKKYEKMGIKIREKEIMDGVRKKGEKREIEGNKEDNV